MLAPTFAPVHLDNFIDYELVPIIKYDLLLPFMVLRGISN